MSDTWQNCYKGNWNGVIVPEAFSHPAKVSFSLAERIYNHMEAQGWITPGMLVIDPFGGIGGFAFHAMSHGLKWVGVELEERFVNIGEKNIEAWDSRYKGKLPHWGEAWMVRGDSRELVKILGGEAQGCVSSPPYSDTEITQRTNFYSANNPGGQVANKLQIDRQNGYSAVVSSPPYAETINSDNNGIDWSKAKKDYPGRTNHEKRIAMHNRHANKMHYADRTTGNLGSMKAQGFEAAVSSPPFTDQLPSHDNFIAPHDNQLRGGVDYLTAYGSSPGQLGTENYDDFWIAARVITNQLYQVLIPGAHVVWVVKSFVKNKKIVDFPHQWQQMCEAAGFTTLHEHHASLVTTSAAQVDIEGNHHRKITERKSFFRRLAEQKGSPRIDYETVFCMEKGNDRS